MPNVLTVKERVERADFGAPIVTNSDHEIILNNDTLLGTKTPRTNQPNTRSGGLFKKIDGDILGRDAKDPGIRFDSIDFTGCKFESIAVLQEMVTYLLLHTRVPPRSSVTPSFVIADTTIAPTVSERSAQIQPRELAIRFDSVEFSDSVKHLTDSR